VELLALTLPSQTLTWILDQYHLKGEEFTMGGRPVQLVLIPPKPKPAPEEPTSSPRGPGRVLRLVRKS
jgi:hypothetical protein